MQCEPRLQGEPINTMSTSGLANDDVPHLNVLANYSLRRPKYSKVLSHLREVVTTTVMIEKMKRPEKVSIVENDEGDMVRDFEESDTIQLYKTN